MLKKILIGIMLIILVFSVYYTVLGVDSTYYKNQQNVINNNASQTQKEIKPILFVFSKRCIVKDKAQNQYS